MVYGLDSTFRALSLPLLARHTESDQSISCEKIAESLSAHTRSSLDGSRLRRASGGVSPGKPAREPTAQLLGQLGGEGEAQVVRLLMDNAAERFQSHRLFERGGAWPLVLGCSPLAANSSESIPLALNLGPSNARTRNQSLNWTGGLPIICSNGPHDRSLCRVVRFQGGGPAGRDDGETRSSPPKPSCSLLAVQTPPVSLLSTDRTRPAKKEI